MAGSKKELLLRIAASVFAGLFLVLIGLVIDHLTFNSLHPWTRCEANKGSNGLWLRFWWVAGKHSPAEQQEMLARLKKYQIKYAYFHVLGTKLNGRLAQHYGANATALTRAVHEQCPGTLAIAWVYVAAAPYKDGVDLNDPQTRKTMVDEARWLTQECGFDGVQWDYEFAMNGHPGLPALLRETKDALPGSHISAATPMWYPGTLWGWDDEYYKKIAPACDQIAVMGYDSCFYSPTIYTWLMEQQVLHATAAAAGSKCTVMIGVPAYEDATWMHHKQTETLDIALRAVAAGWRKLQPNDRAAFDGAAPFADYTTDSAEWNTWSTHWLNKRNSVDPVKPANR